MRKITPFRTTAEYICINQKNIKTSSSVDLSGVHTDGKLNLNLYI